MLISIEGVTRSGKTTLCESLATAMSENGIPVTNLNDLLEQDLVLQKYKEITHPQHIKISNIEELLLYCNRLKRKFDYIQQDSNQVVIVDRYILSVYNFSVVVRKMNSEFVKQLTLEMVNHKIPDITILLTSSFEDVKLRDTSKLASRKSQGIEKYFKKYQLGFIDNLQIFSANSKVINSKMKINDVHNEAFNFVTDQIAKQGL